MATGFDAGDIYYTVSSDTSKLVDSTDAVDKSVDRMGKKLQEGEKAADRMGTQLTQTSAAVKNMGRETDATSAAVGRLIAGMISFQGVKSLVQMAESYGEMAERVQMATSSTAEFEMVQARLLDTANNTYRSLKEAQEGYILTADSLRSMGYSTSEALDITDSLSYSFVKNATAVDRAQSALQAFTNATNKGKVEADAWATIVAAVPTIVKDIATATNLTTAQIREMGASGKITAQYLTEGLRQSLDANKEAAAGMATTVKDAFTALYNNLSTYIGEANKAYGATDLMSKAVLGVAQNIDVLVKGLAAAGAGGMAIYIARLGVMLVEKGKLLLASRAAAVATLAEAKATLDATAAKVAQTAGTVAATQATAAHTAAIAAHAAAQRGLATVMGTVTALLGGPVGIIGMAATAAAGWLLFRQNSDEAKQGLMDLSQPTQTIIEKFRELNASQRELALSQAFTEAKTAADEASRAVDQLVRGPMTNGTAAVRDWKRYSEGMLATLVQELKDGDISLQEFDRRATELVNTFASVRRGGEQWRMEQLQQVSATGQAIVSMNNASATAVTLEANQRNLAAATDSAARAQAEQNRNLNQFLPDAEKFSKVLEDRLAKLKDNGSAVAEATRQLKEWGITEGDLYTKIMATAKAVDKAAAGKKAATSGTKAATKAANEQKTQEEQNAKAIQKMQEQLLFAAVNGEALAVAKARANLNKFATPAEIADMEKMAKLLYQAEQAATREAAARQKAASKRENYGYTTNADGSLTREDPSKLNSYITGDVQNPTGGLFDTDVDKFAIEAEKEKNFYAEQMQRLIDAKELGLITQQGYNDREQELAQAHAERMDRIERNKQQTMLASAEAGFGAAADALKSAFGEQNALYKAAFIAQKAFAIAQAMVAIQQGIALAAANPWPLNLAAMATVAAATAGLISNISSITMGSGKLYGGPTQPDSMHRINENGRPEIFNAANGQQYLLPNTRGRVVSNGDAVGGSSKMPTVTVNLYENRDRAGQAEITQTGEQALTVSAFVEQIRYGGTIPDVLEQTFPQLQRGGT